MKDLSAETPAVTTFRNNFESGRSFDLDDDMEFCPKLLTESDVSYQSDMMSNPYRGINILRRKFHAVDEFAA